MNSLSKHREPYKVTADRDYLATGRTYFERRMWADAFEALTLADRACPLGAEALQLLATSAYLIGHENDCLHTLERAHRILVDTDEHVRAARCAFWIGLCHFFQGMAGPAMGWFARAQRLLDRNAPRPCAE